MSTATAVMTSDELFALPDPDKFERWLINGELREQPMTLRTPTHGRPTGVLSYALEAWCRTRPAPAPMMCNGDIYFRLTRNPDTNVGVDVALATPAQVAAHAPGDRFFDGPPLVAAEVLSGSDTMEDVQEKINAYMASGTPLLWIVDPFDHTVTVYRPGQPPVLFNRTQNLVGDPELPGFVHPIADLFFR